MAGISAYQHGANARKQTRLIAGMFGFSLLLIATVIATLAAVRISPETTSQSSQILIDWPLFWAIGGAVVVVIVLTSIWKLFRMGNDGAKVAVSLGATEVTDEQTDPLITRYRHIVEEVALGASMPPPRVFVLEKETGINAFAAGKSADQAAIAVTRGALNLLSRDELAAVVAHEFAHIRNLDMRLNMRVIGLIHGLMVLYVMGRIFMHSGGRGRKGGAQIMLVGLALILLGLLGAFLGKVMQAAISRQREYLADADGVRYTGNPDALASALKKIGGLSRGDIEESDHDDLEEARHMMFSELSFKLSGMMSTHPPLVKRIQALDPSFDPDREGWPSLASVN